MLSARKTFAVLLFATITGIVWYASLRPTENPAAQSASRLNYANASSDTITVSSTEQSAPTVLRITGNARGYWYFEASFPVEVRDASGQVIGTGYGAAQADWMTEEFVPFIAEVPLVRPYSGPAIITLHKDNPSGEAQFDASASYEFTL